MTARVSSRCSRAPRATRAGVRPRGAARGFSLIVAMLALVLLGMASAAVLRDAIGGERLAGGTRLQGQAGRAAEFALRLCETQLALAASAREVTLLPAATPPAWTIPARWTSGSAHVLTAGDLGHDVAPGVAPRCLMEATAMAGVFVLTARGFSADFRVDPATGVPSAGATVWLQETVLADGGPDAAAGSVSLDVPLTLRQRTWQRLLTPPF